MDGIACSTPDARHAVISASSRAYSSAALVRRAFHGAVDVMSCGSGIMKGTAALKRRPISKGKRPPRKRAWGPKEMLCMSRSILLGGMPAAAMYFAAVTAAMAAVSSAAVRGRVTSAWRRVQKVYAIAASVIPLRSARVQGRTCEKDGPLSSC